MRQPPYCPKCGRAMRKVMRGNLVTLWGCLQLVTGLILFPLGAHLIFTLLGMPATTVFGLLVVGVAAVAVVSAARTMASQKIWYCFTCRQKLPLWIRATRRDVTWRKRRTG